MFQSQSENALPIDLFLDGIIGHHLILGHQYRECDWICGYCTSDRPAPGCPGHRFLRAILEKHAPSDIGRQSLAAVLYNTHIGGPLDALPRLGALASPVPSASGHNFTVL